MTNELKPCPFCGGKARKFREATIPPGEEYVVCLKSSGVNPTCRNDAVLKVDAWNTRPLEDELRAEAASGERWADEYKRERDDLQAEIARLKQELDNKDAEIVLLKKWQEKSWEGGGE